MEEDDRVGLLLLVDFASGDDVALLGTFLYIISRNTPAKPERAEAEMAAAAPTRGAAPVGADEDLASSLCTRSTPRVRSIKESHCGQLNLLLRMITVKKAVESVLSW